MTIADGKEISCAQTFAVKSQRTVKIVTGAFCFLLCCFDKFALTRENPNPCTHFPLSYKMRLIYAPLTSLDYIVAVVLRKRLRVFSIICH